jgi:hypothetical protein
MEQFICIYLGPYVPSVTYNQIRSSGLGTEQEHNQLKYEVLNL